MSKSNNPLSVAEGKLGNVVYFKLKYSADGQRQGAREYVANPSNPRTDAQLSQRCKMTTVTNCYRTFRDVIQRAFEGTAYGQPSYARWSSLAMGANFAGPYQPKGDRRPCPVLGVPMSIGSLPQVTVTGASDQKLITSLASNAVAINTIGDLSANLLELNDWLQAGDQITICLISGGNLEQNLYFGNSYSFYLDPLNTSAVPNIGGCVLTVAAGQLQLEENDWIPMAACVIISREGSHLRSTSYWGYNEEFEKAYIMDGDTDVLPSYRPGSATRSTDWPVNPDAATPVGSFNATTAAAVKVNINQLRIEDGYLVATAYNAITGASLGEVWFFCDDVHSVHYNKWRTGYDTETADAPQGVTSSDTINYRVTDEASAEQVKLLDWLVANGVSERWLYIGG